MEENKKPENHDSFAWSAIETAKHQARMWFIAFLITFVGLIGTNLSWIYVWQLYDTISQDGSGINSYRTEVQGDIINGTENPGEEE